MNFIINFLFRRLSVDSIVASFDKTIAKLETVQARQQEKRDRETDRIERSYAKREKHEQELRRALQTAERFKRLVRGDEEKTSTAGDFTINSQEFGTEHGTRADLVVKVSENGSIGGFGLPQPGFTQAGA
jgi:hypothetical protein